VLSDAQWKMRHRTLRAIVEFAPAIAEACKDAQLQPLRLLKAFALQESGLGVDLDEDGMMQRRVEPAYAPGGRYYKNSEPLRESYSQWGELAASSHGPWQILWATAIRFGWPESREPKELGRPEENCEIAANIFNKEIGDLITLQSSSLNPRYYNTSTLELLADAYNSGNARDQVIPRKYMLSVCAHYERLTDTGGYP